ncbi:MAG TPA: class I SAM-dependent methyltransferase [Patescibacteria group bacterium]|nr:class I SAM-dependent methyltransferase [Patescibacteria group bacterium]
MIECEKPQLFISASQNSRMFEPQPRCMDIIKDWARLCPPSPLGILDLAAGYGVEVQALKDEGIPVIGQEGSSDMRKHAVTKLYNGLVEDLHLHQDGAFGGALLKDTLIFLTPKQREFMFTGVRRILTPGGSFLIISELYDLDDVIRNSSDNIWVFAYDEKEGRNYKKQVISRTICTPEKVEQYAKKYNFSYELVRSYGRDDPLARENRWMAHDGFITKLTLGTSYSATSR